MSTQRKELEKNGWVRQFSVCEPRLSEFVELYESLGYEVKLVPAEVDEEGECSECFKSERDKYKTIYTRRCGKQVVENDLW